MKTLSLVAIATVLFAAAPASAQTLLESGQAQVLSDAAVATIVPPSTVVESSSMPRIVLAGQAAFVVSQAVAIDAARRSDAAGFDNPLSWKETAFLRSFLGMTTLVQSTRMAKAHPKATAIWLFVASGIDLGLSQRSYGITFDVTRARSAR